MKIEINGEAIELLPERAMWVPKMKTLLAADLHFGKINHFRKSGIPVPARANNRNTETLIDLLNRKRPERLIFLGDLFHSHYNPEWEVVGQIRKHFAACSFELVLGNHDILSNPQYARHRVAIFPTLQFQSFILTHEPMERVPENLYNLAGHIHPGVHLRGKGRQSMTLPCFYFGKQQGILPAFGSFTGLARIIPKKEEKIFVIAEGKILEMKSTA